MTQPDGVTPTRADEDQQLAVGRQLVERLRNFGASDDVGPPAGSPRAASSEDEPWFYPTAETVAGVAIVAALLSVVGGLIVGIDVSKYTSVGETGAHHHAGVIAYWIAIGVFAAALWMAFAVGIRLFVDIGRSLRALSRRS